PCDRRVRRYRCRYRFRLCVASSEERDRPCRPREPLQGWWCFGPGWEPERRSLCKRYAVTVGAILRGLSSQAACTIATRGASFIVRDKSERLRPPARDCLSQAARRDARALRQKDARQRRPRWRHGV